MNGERAKFVIPGSHPSFRIFKSVTPGVFKSATPALKPATPALKPATPALKSVTPANAGVQSTGVQSFLSGAQTPFHPQPRVFKSATPGLQVRHPGSSSPSFRIFKSVTPANAGVQSSTLSTNLLSSVIPAEAGIQSLRLFYPEPKRLSIRHSGSLSPSPSLPRTCDPGAGLVPEVANPNAGVQSTGNQPSREVNKQPAVYILASKRNGTIYIGVTSDLIKRIWEHKNDMAEGFTRRYGVHQLVWYELHESMRSAIEREKRLKEWKRAWKLELIESVNPDWQDLYERLV